MDIPGYKIIDTLGEGGMATVYLAIQTSFERKVALKVMSPSLLKDPSFGERFIREARIVSKLVHPNIVTVYDVGVHNSFHFLSMEYVPGNDLKQLRFDLSLEQKVQVVKDIARALDYAGRKGYVHRDVKPENIMIHKEDGRAVLMDFGIAKATDVASGMTQTGTTMGTPHYMSPEQAKGAKVDPRCDLYSLGVVLFQLITGHVPFDADSAVAVGIMHVSEAVPRLPAHLQVFQFIIDRVLAKSPKERYQRGNEFVADLDTITPAQIADIKSNMNTVVHIDTADVNAKTVVSMAASDSALKEQKAITEKNQKPPNAPFNIQASDRIGGNAGAFAGEEDLDEAESAGGSWLFGIIIVLFMAAGGYYWWSLQTGTTNALTETVAKAVTITRSALSVTTSTSASASSVASIIDAEPQTTDYLAEARVLLQRLPENLSEVPHLVSLYRQMQNSEFVGEQQAGLVGLDELARILAAAFNDAVEANNPRATSIATILHEFMPDATRDEHFSEKLASISRAAELEAQLAQAESYLKAGALGSPKGANALESYREILSANAKHPEAQAGIDNIVIRYQQLAEVQLKDGKRARAAALVSRGLKIAPENTSLILLQQEIQRLQRKAQRQRKQERQLLTEAKALVVQDKLIAPRGDNAFETYKALLRLNANQAQALEGLRQVERSLSVRIESLINLDTFDEAALQLASAQDRFPQSATLFALQVQLDDLIESQQPAIARLLISGQAITHLDLEQSDPLNADRVVHIGFAYTNFVGSVNVVQAVLYDGSRSLKIAQTSIIVNNAEGVEFFYIERPVVGFPEGGYHVDLLLGDKRLISLSFNVETARVQENDATL